MRAQRALNDENLALLPDLEDQQRCRSMSSCSKGIWRLAQGDATGHARCTTGRWPWTRRPGLPEPIAWSLTALGEIALLAAPGCAGDGAARRRACRCIGRSERSWGVAECLEQLAEVACAQGQRDHDQRTAPYGRPACLERRRRCRATGPTRCRPIDASRCARAVAATRARLGAEQCAASWAEGRAMSWADAVAYALAEQPVVTRTPTPHATSQACAAAAGARRRADAARA